MESEFEVAEEPRDLTKLVWVVVAILVALMIFALWYTAQPDRSSSYVRARHILISYDATNPAERGRALDLVNELRDRILAGERMDALARQYSTDPQSGPRGGDLGYSKPGDYQKAVEDYVWTAPIGELSEVLSTTYGFHLVLVMERHVSDAARYEQELEEKAKELLRQSTSRPTPAPPASIAAPRPAPAAPEAPETAEPAPEEPAAEPAPETAQPAVEDSVEAVETAAEPPAEASPETGATEEQPPAS